MERVALPREVTAPRRARHYLAPRLSGLGMPPRAAAELLVAVGEAVTNAVLYGGSAARAAVSQDNPITSGNPALSAPQPDARTTESDAIMLELVARGDRVAVAVTSSGTRWRVPAPRLPADPLSSGGRGLYLMREFTDAVRINQNRRGTTVYLIRRLRPDGASDARRPERQAATSPGRRRAG